MSEGQSDHKQRSITQQLRVNLGWSVGVTTATQLVQSPFQNLMSNHILEPSYNLYSNYVYLPVRNTFIIINNCYIKLNVKGNSFSVFVILSHNDL